jgi:hypothetical protein
MISKLVHVSLSVMPSVGKAASIYRVYSSPFLRARLALHRKTSVGQVDVSIYLQLRLSNAQ